MNIDNNTMTNEWLVAYHNKLTIEAASIEKLGGDSYYIVVEQNEIVRILESRGYRVECSHETGWKLVINKIA